MKEKKKMKKVKGFTLVELVISIAIIAILVSIAIPQYNKARLSAVVASHNSNVQTIKSAAVIYEMDAKENETDISSKLAPYIEGNTLPDIPKEVSEFGTSWSVTKDTNGNIEITPGLMEVVNGKVQAKK